MDNTTENAAYDAVVGEGSPKIPSWQCHQCHKALANEKSVKRHLDRCPGAPNVKRKVAKTPNRVKGGKRVVSKRREKTGGTASALYNVAYRKAHKKAGLCIQCPKKVEAKRKGKVRCQDCAIRHYIGNKVRLVEERKAKAAKKPARVKK